MILFPAIDLKDGKCVRLIQGDFQQSQIFSEYPVETALQWQQQGAEWLHLVDLDGALTGRPENRKVVGEIVKALSIPVQLGGGIRSMAYAEEMLSLGVTRIILGTSALADVEFTRSVIQTYTNRVAVSLDAKNGFVAVKGWTEVTDQKAVDVANQLASYGLTTIVYTDIAKDGMMSGPNFDELAVMQQETGLDLIASGGVSTPQDVAKLSSMGLYGAIIGKALYTGSIDLGQVLAEERSRM